MYTMQTKKNSDTSISTTAFFMKCVGFWIAENDEEQRRRNIALGHTTWTSIFAVVIGGRDLYYSRTDWNTFLYVGCNYLSITVVQFKLYITLVHKMEFIELILYMRDHFWNNNYDYYEQEIMAQSRKICILFTTTVTIAAHFSISSYIITPIVDKNESDRILPFNMWSDLPLSMTPYYELMFAIQVLVLYQVSVCYFCFDNLLCIIGVHVAGQFRILQYRLTTLCYSQEKMMDENANINVTNHANKIYEKLKKCIRQHQALIDYCVKLENVFTLTILVQVLVFSVLICLSGFQILVENSSTSRRLGFLTFTVGSAFMLLMFTYSCHGLVEQSDNIGTAAYSALWTLVPMNRAGRMLRNDLLMVIVRSRRVCCVTANGFFPIALETYTKIMSTAVSYFTLLRQHSETVDEF